MILYNTDYHEQLSNNIRDIGGDVCAKRVARAFEQIDEEILSRNDSLLTDEFSLCRPWNISSEMDVDLFFDGIIGLIDNYIVKNQ